MELFYVLIDQQTELHSDRIWEIIRNIDFPRHKEAIKQTYIVKVKQR